MINSEYHLLKVAQNLNPIFKVKKLDLINKTEWQAINFGCSHPRDLIYSDNTQVISIDSRSPSKTTNRKIFLATNKDLMPNELINKSDVIKNSNYYHIVHCSEHMALIDDRFADRVVLKWVINYF